MRPPLDKRDLTRNAEICQELRIAVKALTSQPPSPHRRGRGETAASGRVGWAPSVGCRWRFSVEGAHSSKGEYAVLAPCLVARVGDAVHFLTVTVEQANHATLAGERNGDG